MRASGSDDTVRLVPPRLMNLEQALEFIREDELVEVTPDDASACASGCWRQTCASRPSSTNWPGACRNWHFRRRRGRSRTTPSAGSPAHPAQRREGVVASRTSDFGGVVMRKHLWLFALVALLAASPAAADNSFGLFGTF